MGQHSRAIDGAVRASAARTPAALTRVSRGAHVSPRRRPWRLIATGVLVAMVAVTLLVAFFTEDGDGKGGSAATATEAADAPICANPARLLVTPSDAAMWQSVLDSYQRSTKPACGPIELSDLPADEGAAAAALSSSAGWIARDAAALSALPEALAAVSRTDVIARTPLVVVSGGAAADAAQLLNPPTALSVAVESPAASPAAALGLDELTRALTGQSLQILGSLADPTEADRRVIATVQSMRIVEDSAQLLAAPLAPDAVVLTTEAAAWSTAADAADQRAVVYLDGGGIQLQATLVQFAPSEELAALRSFLGTSAGAAALTAAGLRPAATAGTGATRTAPATRGQFAPIADLPEAGAVDPAQLEQQIGTFVVLTTPVSMIAAMDMSGSMSDQMPGGPPGLTKIDLIRRLVDGLFDIARPDGRSGVITFHSDPVNRAVLDYSVPVDANAAPGHRERASAAFAAAPVGGTPLYNAVVRTYRLALDSYAPGIPNQLVILTDGDNRDTVDTITLEQMAAQLREMIDPQRPINAIVVALGQDADEQTVRQIATAVQGTPLVARDYASYGPAMAQLFLPSR